MNAFEPESEQMLMTDISVAHKLFGAAHRASDPAKAQKFLQLASAACADVRKQLRTVTLSAVQQSTLQRELTLLETRIRSAAQE